jgi:hypothetical protein
MLNFRKSGETRHTGSVASVLLALVIIPAVLIISRPVAWNSLFLSVVCAISYLGFVWRAWSYSQPATLSIYVSEVKYR